MTVDDFGWAEPSGDGPLHNFRYFMRRADITALQRSVLGREFEKGPPGEGQRVRGLTTTTTFKQHEQGREHNNKMITTAGASSDSRSPGYRGGTHTRARVGLFWRDVQTDPAGRCCAAYYAVVAATARAKACN